MLDGVLEEMHGWLDAEPGLSAKAVLARLRRLAPERFQDTQLRTVQRAVKGVARQRSPCAIILGGMATLTSALPPQPPSIDWLTLESRAGNITT